MGYSKLMVRDRMKAVWNASSIVVLRQFAGCQLVHGSYNVAFRIENSLKEITRRFCFAKGHRIVMPLSSLFTAGSPGTEQCSFNLFSYREVLLMVACVRL